MSFRFIATIDRHADGPVPKRFTGRVRVSSGGKLQTVSWYSDGDLDDPSPGTPAFVRFRHNGRPKQIRHYRQGRLHDPALGQPAVVGYYADDSMKYREHFRYGRRHDYDDVPAITKWRLDGSVRTEHSYYEGLRIERIGQRIAS